MIVSASSSPNTYKGQTEKSANRNADMFVLGEGQQQQYDSSYEITASTSGETSFSTKLASMFLIPERSDVESKENSLVEDSLSIYERQFMELADKTLAERIRDQYLEDHDLTEDDVNAMSPEDQQAVEDEIRDAILEAIGANEKQQNIAISIDLPVSAAIIAGSAEDETTQL